MMSRVPEAPLPTVLATAPSEMPSMPAVVPGVKLRDFDISPNANGSCCSVPATVAPLNDQPVSALAPIDMSTCSARFPPVRPMTTVIGVPAVAVVAVVMIA